LLLVLDRFEALSPQERVNFMIGRRVGLYKVLQDMNDQQRYDVVEQIKFKLNRGNKKFDPKIIFTLMEDFI
jgi:hypothetical protein